MFPSRQTDFGILSNNYGLSALTFRIFSDNTDDIDFPTRGRQNHFLMERGLTRLGSSYDYLQTFYQSKIHFSISNQRVLTLMVYATYLNRNLPYFSNFKFGGEEHMMGYYEGELWGQNFASVGFRYRQRFTQSFYWFAQLNTGGTINDYKSISQKELNTGFGLGLIFQSLLGPFSVSYGYANSSHQLLYLSVGHSF
jgi:outer membrane translocation and assembly module TamA